MEESQLSQLGTPYWLAGLLTDGCSCTAQIRAQLPAGVDGWGYSLKGMMGMVVVGGLLITLTYFAMQRKVVPKVMALQKVRLPKPCCLSDCVLALL